MSLLEVAVAELGSRLAVRCLAPSDLVPAELRLGFRQIDAEWAWGAVEHGRVVAVLLAAPCHGMVFLARLAVLPKYGWTLPRLFRQFVKDALARGYAGYYTALDPMRKEEYKLGIILDRAGGTVVAGAHNLYGGKLSDLEKW